ncbi:hypothetical protein D1872_294200 [compost metagenome]
MERLTVKAYAKKQKLSIYNVIKMARTGVLKSETVEEEGKEVLYILTEPEKEAALQEEILPRNPPKNMREENRMLKEEIKRLKEELARCKKSGR